MQIVKIQSLGSTKYSSQIIVYAENATPILPDFLAESLKPKAGETIGYFIKGQYIVLCCLKEGARQNSVSAQLRLALFKNLSFLGDNPLLTLLDLEVVHISAALIGARMVGYELGYFKTSTEKTVFPTQLSIFGNFSEELLEKAISAATCQMRAMELVDRPSNQKTPEYFAKWVEKSALKNDFKVTIFREAQILENNLHALHAVGKGSKNLPTFIICTYFGKIEKNTTDLAFVGKGVTFDTGGISIKPSANMHYMKSDMAGAAAVFSAFEYAVKQKLALNLVCIIPAAENAVDANSMLPGDVISSYSGQTIEVLDTDAEGRLVLADGLAYAIKNFDPKIILDMATLTGSSVRTFATDAACLYATDTETESALRHAGDQTGERLWPMPLWPEYDVYMQSDIADIKNLASIPAAGSITAAKFLQKFTSNHPNWVHIDMPGMAFKDGPFGKMKSATGYGVQLLIGYMHNLLDKN